jgi:plasmid stabilization system protein ParE
MNVIFFPQADDELEEAATYYDSKLPGLRRRFLGAIEQAIAEIREHPNRWPVVRGVVRRRWAQVFPYSVLYVAYHDEILIVAIMHSSRHPLYWVDRLE